MACFPFRWRQSDNRLNIHSIDEVPAIRPITAPRSEPMTQMTMSRAESKNGVGPLHRVRSNGRSRSPTRKRNSPAIDSTPARPGKEVRPTGLFADVKPPLLVQASSPIKHTYHSERRGNMAPPQRQDVDRGRRRGPSGEVKANKVLGRQQDPRLRHGDLSPTFTNSTASNESLRLRSTVAVPKSAMVKDKALREKRVRRPKAYELPSSFHDVMEKQIVVGPPSSTVSTDSQPVNKPQRNDSAAELPADFKGDGSAFAPVELPAEDVTVQAVELPGSHPFVAECDAGPPPPTELPGSFAFSDEQAYIDEKMKTQHEEVLKPNSYPEEKPVLYELPARVSR